MLKSQFMALCAVATLAACSSTPPSVSHARPTEPRSVAYTQPANATPGHVERLTLRGDANFETNSATLTESAVSELDRLIEGTRHTALDSISIAGYTDASGSDAHNQELSEQRALSVAKYLAVHGMRTHGSVQVSGFGKANPIASNTTAEGRAQNRRVEIVLNEQKVKSQ
jgi:outer membrane protein OmpA-like peptidoglycan-associated protein